MPASMQLLGGHAEVATANAQVPHGPIGGAYDNQKRMEFGNFQASTASTRNNWSWPRAEGQISSCSVTRLRAGHQATQRSP